MTYDERQIANHKHSTRIPAIVAAMAVHTGDAWTVRKPYDNGYHVATRTKDGLEIGINTGWTKADAFHVSYNVPPNVGGGSRYVRAEDKIDSANIGTSKRDERIAAEIVRRIVGPAESAHAGYLADIAGTTAYYDTCRAHAAEVATAIGGSVWTRDRNEHVGERSIRHNLSGVGEITVSGSGVVSIALSLTVPEAIALLTARPQRPE